MLLEENAFLVYIYASYTLKCKLFTHQRMLVSHFKGLKRNMSSSLLLNSGRVM